MTRVERLEAVLKGYVENRQDCTFGPDGDRSLYGEACSLYITAKPDPLNALADKIMEITYGEGDITERREKVKHEIVKTFKVVPPVTGDKGQVHG